MPSAITSLIKINGIIDESMDDDVIRNVECIIELVMIRDKLHLSSDVFSLMDIRDVISFLCTG